MMLATTLIFFVALTGSLGESDDRAEVRCIIREHSEQGCDMIRRPSEFPNSVDELKETCSYLKASINCTLRVIDRCPDRLNKAKYGREIKDYIDEVCEDDNSLFEEISRNIGCIADTINKYYEEACLVSSYSEETRNRVISQVIEFLKNTPSLSEDDQYCLYNYWDNMCPAALVDRLCGGYVPGSAVYNVMTNTDMGHKLCGKEKVEAMEPLSALFASVIDDRLKEIRSNE